VNIHGRAPEPEISEDIQCSTPVSPPWLAVSVEEPESSLEAVHGDLQVQSVGYGEQTEVSVF